MAKSQSQDRAAQRRKLEAFKNEAGKLRPSAAPVPESEQVHLLGFLLDGRRYAVDVDRVLEIAVPASVTPVATAGESVLGVVSLRGVVVTMVDVRRHLRHSSTTPSQHVIVFKDSGGPLGFEVDRVLRPVLVPRDSIVSPPPGAPSLVGGVFGAPNALTSVLDLDKLFS